MNSKLDKNKKRRDRTLLFFGLSAIVAGYLTVLFAQQENLLNLLSILMSISSICLLYYWVIYDARLRNYRIPKWIKYLIILITIIGLPIYFWRTRSIKDFCLNIGGYWLIVFYSFCYLAAAYLTTILFG